MPSLLAAGFAGYSFVSTPTPVAIETEGSAFTEGKLVMNSPKLEGFTEDGRPYSVNATRATQDFDKQDIISLDGIDAKMPIEAENWARVEAVSGVYDRTANTLDVPTDILVTTTDGMVAKFKSAFLDIANGSLKSTTPVDIQSHGSIPPNTRSWTFSTISSETSSWAMCPHQSSTSVVFRTASDSPCSGSSRVAVLTSRPSFSSVAASTAWMPSG